MTFSDYINYLRDKRIGVIGFGVSNQPLVRVLLRNGLSALSMPGWSGVF